MQIITTDDRNNTSKMAEILGRLKIEMNGAVTDSMRDMGISYPLNYGVSIPTIKMVCQPYYPDHGLAKLLYRQEIRELRLAGIFIADPAKVTTEELPFWEAGIINSEVAEHLASTLLSKTSVVDDIFSEWAGKNTVTTIYAGLLALSKSLVADTGHSEIFAGGFTESAWRFIEIHITSLLSSSDKLVWNGMAKLLGAVARKFPLSHERIRALLYNTTELIENSAAPLNANSAETHNKIGIETTNDANVPMVSSLEYLRDEIAWQLD